MCADTFSRQERFEYLWEHYSQYIEDTFEEGEEVEVSDNGKDYEIRSFLYKDKQGKFWTRTDNQIAALPWTYCRKPLVKKVTMDEVEAKFGCKVEIVNG